MSGIKSKVTKSTKNIKSNFSKRSEKLRKTKYIAVNNEITELILSKLLITMNFGAKTYPKAKLLTTSKRDTRVFAHAGQTCLLWAFLGGFGGLTIGNTWHGKAGCGFF